MNHRVDYLKIKPVGTCKLCGINLWAEHGRGPAPTAMPCRLQGCGYQTSAEIISFPRSTTGNPIALIESM